MFFFLLAQTALALTPPHLITPWSPLPNLPDRVFEAAGTRLYNGSKPILIISGGYIEASNLNTTSATTIVPLSPPRTPRQAAPHPFHITHMAHASNGSVMYTCGGFLSRAPGVSTQLCHSYNIAVDTWERLPDLPSTSGGGGMVYIAQLDALFYAGGAFRNGTFGGIDTGRSYMLFLGNQTSGWHERAAMPDPRNHLAAVVVSGRIFFLGGQKGGNEVSGNSDTVREYIWSKDVWIVRKNIPFPLGHVSASVFKYRGGIMVVGGITTGRTLSDKVLFYDVRGDEWYDIARFPRTVQSPVCVSWGPVVFCASGFGKPGWAHKGYFGSFSPPVRD